MHCGSGDWNRKYFTKAAKGTVGWASESESILLRQRRALWVGRMKIGFTKAAQGTVDRASESNKSETERGPEHSCRINTQGS